jgi:hypothetical protein
MSHVLLFHLSHCRDLSQASPLSGQVETEIEYRDLIFASLNVQGNGHYKQNVSVVLNSQVTMCYLKSDIMGLSVSDKNPLCTNAYGCGESFNMNILLVDSSNQVNYHCLLLKETPTKHEGILGINFFLKDGTPISTLTLKPHTPSEITFSSTGAEYTVSKGTMEVNKQVFMGEDYCDGDITPIYFVPEDEKTKFSLFSATDIKFIDKLGNHVVEGIRVTLDLNLAQTEYSSGLLEIMDFKYLEFNENTSIPRLDRENLKLFTDIFNHLKVGVDVLRNLTVHFRYNQSVALICKPKYAALTEPGNNKQSTSIELHGIAVAVKREEEKSKEPVKILIEYIGGVYVSMMRSDKYLQIVLDTGSSFTHVPQSNTYSCEKGDSSFYCKYGSGEHSAGSKTPLVINFPTREQRNSVSVKKSTVISGINKVDSLTLGIIGLQYTETMDSMPYIWNTEWMVFIPEVINPMLITETKYGLPKGPTLGRLELTQEFDASEYCDGGQVVTFSADRSTWIVKDLIIAYTGEDRKEKEYKFDSILVDTGCSMSMISEEIIAAQINKSSKIKIKSTDGSSISLNKEEGTNFFSKGEKSVIGVNILRRLVAGFKLNKERSETSSSSGQVQFCVPGGMLKSLSGISKQELYKSERNKIEHKLERAKNRAIYSCSHYPGYVIFREKLQSSWKIEDKNRVSLVDLDDVKKEVVKWAPWNDCFDLWIKILRESGIEMSEIILESILQSTVSVDDPVKSKLGSYLLMFGRIFIIAGFIGVLWLKGYWRLGSIGVLSSGMILTIFGIIYY